MMNEKGKTQAVSAFVACLMLFFFSAQALSATITSWGRDSNNEVTDTPLDTNFTAIAGGGYHSLALSVSAVPLPASAWMGLALLGGIGGYGLIRRRLCSVNTPL